MISITGNDMMPSQNVLVRRFSEYSRSATSQVLLLAMGEVLGCLAAADGAHEDLVQRGLARVEAAHLDALEQLPQQQLRVGPGRQEQLGGLAGVVDAHHARQRGQRRSVAVVIE